MEDCDKADRGTVITLYIAEDEKEFAQKTRIQGLLNKYCKFMPVPVIFGKEQEWKDGKYVDTDKDNIINKVEPLWARKPADLKDEDYKEFYRTLYPMADEPLFHIHLNVDYPFNLTGILYFPKIKNNVEISRNKIQLYCNQMFVTDSVDNIVPDFLTLLHGVIDSPDIPLNVSRSYLQSDSNVKKISTYITKKVADRLDEIYREYGYSVTELRSYAFGGADGFLKMQSIMDCFRKNAPTPCGISLEKSVDYLNGIDGLPKSNVLKLHYKGASLTARPSGTEPKLKLYVYAEGNSESEARDIAAKIFAEAEKLIK
jgi:hypothetical protein